MKIPSPDHRGAQAARAALEAQRASRLQDAMRADAPANVQRLQGAQLRQEQEDLARQSTDRERCDGAQTFSGPSN